MENNLVCPKHGEEKVHLMSQGDSEHLPAAPGSPGRWGGAAVPGQDTPWEVRQQQQKPGQRCGSCATDAGLWQGAEEVLQQH